VEPAVSAPISGNSVLLGTPQPDGAMRIDSLTHHTIADYVGTSREVVTFQMNRIRRLGLIRYNRRYIDVYSRAVAEALRLQGIHLSERPAAGSTTP
jgi:hypothetical protein